MWWFSQIAVAIDVIQLISTLAHILLTAHSSICNLNHLAFILQTIISWLYLFHIRSLFLLKRHLRTLL